MINPKIVLARKSVAVLFLILITGCTSPRDEGPYLAHDAGWQWNIISTDKFDLATAQPPSRHGETLWVYIEGDGLAFLSPSVPSSDPTPTHPVALRLALAHPGTGPVAYLARPCQYTMRQGGRNCARRYWTDARYAPEVVDSANQAIDSLKKQTGATRVILAGYSGGGAMAVLAAAKRRDVVGIVTVVADLDLAYWVKRDDLTPLQSSLNPANFAADVASIPQIHFTGERDTTAGTDIVQSFMKRSPPRAPAHLIEIPDFDHACCWVKEWAQLLARPDVKPVLGLQ